MEPAQPHFEEDPLLHQATFRQRLTVLTFGLLLTVLIIYLLREFKAIFQPLFVAVFIAYLVLPIHHWLVRRGVPSLLAAVVILLLVLGALFGLGSMVYHNFQQLLEPGRLGNYVSKVDGLLQQGLEILPMEVPNRNQITLRGFLTGDNSVDRFTAAMGSAVGTFVDFFAALAITFVYLLFLVAEKFTFPQRICAAFGPVQASNVLNVVGSINQAIAQYIAVKSFVSLLAGILSLLVLAAFGIEFCLMWGVLIGVLNFIPYLGSLIAVIPPIILGFLQFDSPWPGISILVLLNAIQLGIGYGIEPRLAGQKLNVSPLLIVLSLSFWGLIWGIVGMILAVPLLVISKIILDNIPQTRPLATLISNV